MHSNTLAHHSGHHPHRNAPAVSAPAGKPIRKVPGVLAAAVPSANSLLIHLLAARRGEGQTYPDHPAEMGSEDGHSDCVWGCTSLRNLQELSGFSPVLTTPPPASSAQSWTVALNISRVAGSRWAGEYLGSGAGLRESSGSQRDGWEEGECHRLRARPSPWAGERGRAPGDTFFSFGGACSVSCVWGAVGQVVCQLLPMVYWHLHRSPACLGKRRGHEGAPGLPGDRLAGPLELPPAA